MPNREKVIKGLMELHGSEETMTIISDAIALLKEQEPKYVQNIGQQISCLSGLCPNCGKMLNTTCNKRFCGDCGQAVRWG